MLGNFLKACIGLLVLSIAGCGPMVYAQNVKTYIPERAFPLLPIVHTESKRLLPDLEYTYYFGALIEHESCIGLKHSRCWSPTSELKSKREQGVGLGQITRAYREDGSIRFDALTDLRKQYLSELRDLSWSTVKNRPDLQIRAVVLLTKNNLDSLRNVIGEVEKLKLADAAYNGGISGLQKERRACNLSKGCDPDIWDNNVERFCLKSKKPLYAGRSACDINRHHVKDVFYTRMPKYSTAFNELDLK